MKLLIQVTAIGVLLVGCGANVVFGGDDGNGGEGTGANGTGAGIGSGAGTNAGAGSSEGGSGAAPPDTTVSTGGSTSTSPVPDPIPCGDTACDPVTQDCCLDFNDTSCVAHGDFCQGALLSCAGAANCDPGLVCCAHFGMGGPPEAACESDCPGGPQSGTAQLCLTDEECLHGHCQQGPGGFQICQGGGMGGGGGNQPP